MFRLLLLSSCIKAIEILKAENVTAIRPWVIILHPKNRYEMAASIFDIYYSQAYMTKVTKKASKCISLLLAKLELRFRSD